jgi:UDP-glucose 4-epimerase
VADERKPGRGSANRHDPHYVKPPARVLVDRVRVAVTGAAGLIGRALVSALAGDSRVSEVVAIDVRPPAPGPHVRALQRDVAAPGLVSDLAGIDALVHLAFREHGRGSAGAPHVADSQRAFAAATAVGAKAIVYASSAWVYGAAADNPVPLREDHPPRPGDFDYPRAKLVLEAALADLAARRPGVRIACLRPTTVVGPGTPLLLARRAYVSLSDFDPPMQFTWVDDVAAAFAAAVLVPATGVFNVGASGTVRASEVAALLGVRSVRLPYRARRAAATALTALRVPGALDPRYVELHRYPIVVSSARAEADLGWRAEQDSAEALRRFAATRR